MTETILLSAGGTGGHVFPAIALGEELHRRGYRTILATDARAAHYDYPDWLEVHVLSSKSTAGGIFAKIGGLLSLLKAVIQAAGLVRKTKPGIIVGFGGYPSFPAIAVAIGRSIPLVLHEQNRYLGKANRMAIGRAKTVALSFHDTQGVDPKYQDKCIHVGNPPRPEILALRDKGYQPPVEGGAIELLVFAGSQGAHMFSEVVPGAIGMLPESLRRRLRVVQQCRQDDIAFVLAQYKDWGIEAKAQPFFHDMPQRLTKAHLVVCRSGASTMTEMTAIGCPAIYVPLAIAADDHQTLNAQYLESKHAGWLLPSSQFEPEALAARLRHCLEYPHLLEKAAEEAHKLGTPNAASRLAEVVLHANTDIRMHAI